MFVIYELRLVTPFRQSVPGCQMTGKNLFTPHRTRPRRNNVGIYIVNYYVLISYRHLSGVLFHNNDDSTSSNYSQSCCIILLILIIYIIINDTKHSTRRLLFSTVLQRSGKRMCVAGTRRCVRALRWSACVRTARVFKSRYWHMDMST